MDEADGTTKEESPRRMDAGPPPIVDGGLHPALTLFVAGYVGVGFIGVAVAQWTSPAPSWSKLAVIAVIGSVALAAARSFRITSDAEGIERRVFGLRDRWSWAEFRDGRMKVGHRGWQPASANVWVLLRRMPHVEWAAPAVANAIDAHLRSLADHQSVPPPEPGGTFWVFGAGRIAFEPGGLLRRGTLVPWGSIDRVEVTLPTRGASWMNHLAVRMAGRPIHVSFRRSQGQTSARLLSTIRTTVPTSLLREWIDDEPPATEEERDAKRERLVAVRNECRTALVILTSLPALMVGLLAWESWGRGIMLWEPDLPVWLNLARLAAGVAVVLLYATFFAIPWVLVLQRRRRTVRALADLDAATTEPRREPNRRA